MEDRTRRVGLSRTASGRERSLKKNDPLMSTLRNQVQSSDNEISMADVEYNKEDVLGEGTFGTVYKVYYQGRVVAMKTLKLQKFTSAEYENLKREVTLLASLDHPNIVSLIGVTLDPGNISIFTGMLLDGNSVIPFDW